jgi:hypothetical protein
MTVAVTYHAKGSVLKIYTEGNAQPGSVYNFVEIGLSQQVAESFVRAFMALQGANSIESQRACWIHVKYFGNFLAEKIGRPKRLPRDCLSGFDSWLFKREFGQKTIGAAHNTALRFLRWCQRNAPEALHPKLELFRLPHAAAGERSQTSSETVPEEALIKNILAACYSEIEDIEKRIHETRELPLSPEPNDLADAMMQLLMYGDGELATRQQCNSMRGGTNFVHKLRQFGGLRAIREKYYLTGRDVFPFYLAILTQTSGNPQSLLNAKQDCIIGVPMRDDLERVVWDKERARREQAPDFSKSKEWGAPNIVRKLKVLNSELRAGAREKFSESLFLCRNLHGHVARPSWQAIHDCLKEFRERHRLPKFDLRSLRSAGGRLHHQAGRSIATAKQRLQHASDSTTQKYTPLSDLRGVHDRTILRFQGLLISGSSHPSVNAFIATTSEGIPIQAETVFGFDCKDPLSGIAAGSAKGHPCPSFSQCATCPGAMVVVDDPALVAKLIRSQEHLLRERERATREGWSRRFESLYAPTLSILQRDILPSVSNATMERARVIFSPVLPRLE